MYTIFIFVIVIGIIILIHEFGHFIGARMSGMRVDIFSVGMGQRLFGYNKDSGFTLGKLSDDWESEGKTDYRLSLFPIGGYVKIVGMIDESLDTDFVKSEPQPWEFRSKNVFQKIIALSGGVIMNIVLAVTIFAGIAFVNGKDIWDTTKVGYVPEMSLANTLGLQFEDQIFRVNDDTVKTWEECVSAIALEDFGDFKEIEVIRSGKRVFLKTSGEAIVKTLDRDQSIKLFPAEVSILASSILPNNPADKAGILKGDVIVSINDEKICSPQQIMKICKSHKEIPIKITWTHDGQEITTMVTPTIDGIIGIGLNSFDYTGPVSHTDYSFFESIGIGFSETYRNINLFLNTISEMIKGNLSFFNNIGGPLAIAKQASAQADRGFDNFLIFVAILSTTLAIINILPFPALDGGHLVFIIIEGITRREIPLKVKILFQQVGIVILLLLMAVIIFNDFFREYKDYFLELFN